MEIYLLVQVRGGSGASVDDMESTSSPFKVRSKSDGKEAIDDFEPKFRSYVAKNG